MKKLFSLLVTALFLLIPGIASAGTVKLSGEMHFVANMQHALSTDTWMGWTPGQFVPLGIQQQAKMNFHYVASEDLSAFIQLQAGELHPLAGRPEWGLGPKFFSNGGNFTVNQAYLDWLIPGTKALVRMGLQSFELPMYTWFHGSLVHNDRMAGIRVSLPVSERLSLSAAWFRTAVATHAETSGGNFIALTGDLVLPSFKFSPYFIWANRAYADSLVFSVGHYWFLGAGAEYAPEGSLFRLTADFVYSSYKDHLNVWTGKTYDTKGWVGAASVSYKTGLGIPTLKGWYSSGDGKGKPFASGQLQGLTSTCWPTTVYFGATYVPTAIGFDSTYYSMSRVPGTAGLALEWNGASFMPGLFHNARIAYVRGTNSPLSEESAARGGHCRNMTRDDHFIEADFDTLFTFDPHILFVFQVGYLWEGFKSPMIKNGWRTTLSVSYRF